MPYRLPFSITILILLAVLGCAKSSPTAPETHTDSLTLGTGRKGDTLTGETNVFAGNLSTIYWRVETQEKFKGGNAELEVEKYTETGWEKVYSAVFELIAADDYVAISSYYHMYGTGRFRATGYVGSLHRQVGTIEFTVQEAVKKI